jgi:hypothetical protein
VTFASLYSLVGIESMNATAFRRLDRLAIHNHHRWTGFPSRTATSLLVEHAVQVNPDTTAGSREVVLWGDGGCVGFGSLWGGGSRGEVFLVN